MSSNNDDVLAELRQLREQNAQLKTERDQERQRGDQERQRADQERNQAEQERNQAEQERRRAEQERQRADQEKQRANEERNQAEQERQRAERSEFTQRNTNLLEFLNAAHLNLSLSITIQQDKSLTTKGDMTDPTGKHIPTVFEPWAGFLDQQFQFWKNIGKANPIFKTDQLFDSLHHIQAFKRKIMEKPMGSEPDLEFYERQNVESHVIFIVQKLLEDNKISKRLRLEGNVEFEYHLNTLKNEDAEVSHRLRKIQLTTPVRHPIHHAVASSSIQSSNRPKVDKIAIYHNQTRGRIACMIIEYKAAHKLTLANIQVGLQPMNPNEDIINNPVGPSPQDQTARFAWNSKRLIAAAMCQCFSYMIDCGLMYGYVCTGEAFIFLQIPDDPTTAYYFLSVPNTDVGETTGWEPESAGSNRLHLTAIGQVLIFTLRAMRQKPRDQEWQDKARINLKKWQVDYDELLLQIPETERKEPESSEYRPSTAPSNFSRSPHLLRSKKPLASAERCDTPKLKKEEDESESSDEYADDFDTPSRPRTSRTKASSTTTPTKSSREEHEHRPYCTQACLRGLLSKKGLLDTKCPNFPSHAKTSDTKHHTINRVTFRKLMRKQLAQSRDIDVSPWYLQGSRGAMFKITLSSHGYTVAAKGTVFAWMTDLQHEARIYKLLGRIQGVHIPVCLGGINLLKPFYFGHGVDIIHMMFMAYGGMRIDKHPTLPSTASSFFNQQIASALSEIHNRGILHQDPFPRNILWNDELRRPLFIDFERSEILPSRHLDEDKENRPEGEEEEEEGGGDKGEKRTGWEMEKGRFEWEMKVVEREVEEVLRNSRRGNKVL